MANSIWACERCGKYTLIKSRRNGGYKCITCGSIQQTERFRKEEEKLRAARQLAINENKIKESTQKKITKIPNTYSTIGSRPKVEKKRNKAFEVTLRTDPYQDKIDSLKEKGSLDEDTKTELTEKDNPYYCPYDNLVLKRTDVTIKKYQEKMFLYVCLDVLSVKEILRE